MTTYNKRKESGVCVACGMRYSNNGTLFCDICREKRNRQTKKDKAQLRAKRLCVDCRQPLINEQGIRCLACKEKDAKSVLNRRQQHRDSGLCVYCGRRATVGKKFPLCEDCWFKDIAKGRTGSRRIWLGIKELLQAQNYRCAYTGKELIIGENASLDHVIPKSKGGSNSISNLQWVDLQINVMKNNMSHQEFISTIQLILSRQTLQEKTYAVA